MMPFPRSIARENNPPRKSISPFLPGTGLNSPDKITKSQGSCCVRTAQRPPLPGSLPRAGSSPAPATPLLATAGPLFRAWCVFLPRWAPCASGLALWWFHEKAAGPRGVLVHLLRRRHGLPFWTRDTLLVHSNPRGLACLSGSAAEVHQQPFSCLSACLGSMRQKMLAFPSFQVKSSGLDSISKVLRLFVLKRISYEIPNCISLVARFEAFLFLPGPSGLPFL